MIFQFVNAFFQQQNVSIGENENHNVDSEGLTQDMTASNAHPEGLEALDITREAVCQEPDHGLRLRLVHIDGGYIVRRFNP